MIIKGTQRHALPNHLGDPMIPMITFMDFMSVFQIDGWNQWRAAFAKLILGDSSPQSAADSTTCPPSSSAAAHSSARGLQSAASRSSSQSALSPPGERSSSSGQGPGLDAASPVSLDGPLPRPHPPIFCASPASPPAPSPTHPGWAGCPNSLPRPRRARRQHHPLRHQTTDTGLRARAAER